MAMSGIEVDAVIPELFNDIKMKHKHKWATFKIENKKKIVVDQLGDPKTTETKEDDQKCFEDLKEVLVSDELKKEPRYVLFDFGFTNEEGRKLQKLAFIFWCRDDGPIGLKMIYASSKDTIKKSFTGLSLEFQANDVGDFDYKEFSDEVERKA